MASTVLNLLLKKKYSFNILADKLVFFCGIKEYEEYL